VLADLWSWLETLPVAVHIAETWWFPLLESLHVVTSTFVVGSILMVDLRLLGVAAMRYPVSRIVRDVIPWTWGAAALSALTGLGLFASRASHYAANPAFQIKMALLVAAAVNMAAFHLITARRIATWDLAAPTPLPSRLAGAASLFLWAGVMLAGRWVGHLN
jgi:hypothetical protein